MIIAITVTSAAVIIIMVNSLSGTKFQQGTVAYDIAKSGAENAMLRLIRDPSYTGETLPVGSGNAVIQVSNSGTTYTISSQGNVGNFSRTIEVTATYINNLFTVISQREIF